jgi:HAD superfamily hydrolase (TIGR01549 family)
MEAFDIISVDIFDTILLRDSSIQRVRFMEAARLLSAKLQVEHHIVDSHVLLQARHLVHKLVYRAVGLERPDGDATLVRMAEIQASLAGLEASLVPLFIEAELETECQHLAANKCLREFLSNLRQLGKRVIAISDTYMSAQNIRFLIQNLIEESPIEQVYTSSDLNLTKHSGQIFERVAHLENASCDRIVHCGDNVHSDVAMARAAGCHAIFLPRSTWVKASRKVSAAVALSNPKRRLHL